MVRNVFAYLFFLTDDGVLGNCVQQRWRAMFLHLFLKHTMAFLEIAFNIRDRVAPKVGRRVGLVLYFYCICIVFASYLHCICIVLVSYLHGIWFVT